MKFDSGTKYNAKSSTRYGTSWGGSKNKIGNVKRNTELVKRPKQKIENVKRNTKLVKFQDNNKNIRNSVKEKCKRTANQGGNMKQVKMRFQERNNNLRETNQRYVRKFRKTWSMETDFWSKKKKNRKNRILEGNKENKNSRIPRRKQAKHKIR